MRSPLSYVPFLALVAISAVAHADTVYTSPAAYAAATTPGTTITFDGIASPGSFVNEPNPVVISGATFSSATGSAIFVIDPGFYGSSYPSGFLNLDYGPTGINQLTISFASPVTGLSFNYGGLSGPSGIFTVVLSDGFTTTISTSQSIHGTGSLDFVGFTSTVPLTSVSITTPDAPDYNAFDNVTLDSTVTPEPSSFALLGTGIVGVFGLVRRRLRA
jgi:hypothetical protein